MHSKYRESYSSFLQNTFKGKFIKLKKKFNILKVKKLYTYMSGKENI